MTAQLNVHFLPSLTTPEAMTGATVVVIDVLRATTTIVHALAAGAEAVIPCLEVDEARQIASSLNEPCVLGGERGGLRIEGFDLGNSPTEYTHNVVSHKTIVMTTTNGTRAMMQCCGASRVLIGAFVNFSAVCRALPSTGPIHLLCSGTRGETTREDVLLSGAVVGQLRAGGLPETEMNDQALIAADAWCVAEEKMAGGVLLAEILRLSRGGRNLVAIGQANDLNIAAQIDRFEILPELDVDLWRIQ